MDQDIRRRVLYILHRGLVEARLLVKERRYDQVFDLADALEQLPGFLDKWRDEYMDYIRANLKEYRTKYPSTSFDYLREFDVYPIPDRL